LSHLVALIGHESHPPQCATVPLPAAETHAPSGHTNSLAGHAGMQTPVEEHTSLAVQVLSSGHLGVQTPFVHT